MYVSLNDDCMYIRITMNFKVECFKWLKGNTYKGWNFLHTFMRYENVFSRWNAKPTGIFSEKWQHVSMT